MGESPFLLNGTIKEYLTTSKQRYPESAAHIEEIEGSLYVDDLITSDATKFQKVQETVIGVFRDAKFKLNKWHSNVKELDDSASARKRDISFEKQELRTKTSESEILGVLWNKVKDTFGVDFQERDAKGFGINIRHSWHHLTSHATCKGHVQRSMRPEAALGPKTTGRPHETMDNMDKGVTT